MEEEKFDHGLPDNPYNKHAWILGEPEIGERVWIGAFCLIDAQHAPLKIGRGTDISSGAQILTHTTVKRSISERRFGQVEAAPIEIGEFCFIGTNAVVLMGAKIGHHSVIAAGAVVPQGMKVPPFSLVVGVPAKVVGSSRKYLRGVDRESISIVIPAYNEEVTVESVAKEVIGELKKLKLDYELVLVDDGSTDQTGKIIDRLARRNRYIRTFHHKKNRGFTGVMKTGFASAKKHLIFLAPADGQFNFRQLPRFVEAIRGYDVALGYRVKNEEDFIRKINSRLFHFLCQFLFDIRLREISTVSLWRRSVIESINIESSNRSAMFLPEVIHKALKKRYKFTEVPIHWRLRQGGEPKGAGPKTIFITLVEMIKLWVRTR